MDQCHAHSQLYMPCKAAAAVSQARHSSAVTNLSTHNRTPKPSFTASKISLPGAPAFSGDVACAMATLVTFQAPEMGILPGLALLLGMPCLIHNASIICGYEEAWWVQQVAPLQGQQAADARHPPLIQRPACVPVRWPQTGGMFRPENCARDGEWQVLC